MGQEEMEAVFQKSYVDPAMQTYQQQVLPAIQQRFVDSNASSSSALNQALAQSASQLSTNLGSQYGQFYQNQQGRQQNAISQFLPMLTGQNFTPMIQQNPGLLPSLLQGFGSYAAGRFGS
jgi:hypothetical protein